MSQDNTELTTHPDNDDWAKLIHWDSIHGDDTILVIKPDGIYKQSYSEEEEDFILEEVGNKGIIELAQKLSGIIDRVCPLEEEK